jgi:molecular chaperone DnaK
MGKMIGIDLGTTNSVVAIMEGGEPKVIPTRRAPVRRPPSSPGTARVRSSSVRWPAARPSPTPRTRSTASSASWVGASPRSRRAPARALQRRRGQDRRAGRQHRRQGVDPPRNQRQGPAEAQARRGEVPGRDGHRGRHHRARVLQRRAAPGHQGRRPHRRPRGQAHRQRAHGGRAGLRPRQEEGRARRVYDLGGGTFDISVLEVGENVVEVISPTATPTSAATTSTSASSTT